MNIIKQIEDTLWFVIFRGGQGGEKLIHSLSMNSDIFTKYIFETNEFNRWLGSGYNGLYKILHYTDSGKNIDDWDTYLNMVCDSLTDGERESILFSYRLEKKSLVKGHGFHIDIPGLLPKSKCIYLYNSSLATQTRCEYLDFIKNWVYEPIIYGSFSSFLKEETSTRETIPDKFKPLVQSLDDANMYKKWILYLFRLPDQNLEALGIPYIHTYTPEYICSDVFLNQLGAMRFSNATNNTKSFDAYQNMLSDLKNKYSTNKNVCFLSSDEMLNGETVKTVLNITDLDVQQYNLEMSMWDSSNTRLIENLLERIKN